MKDRTRALRRFQKERLIKRTERIFKETKKYFTPLSPKLISKRVDNMKQCSCSLCTPNRKNNGPPISELRKDYFQET